MNNSDKERFAKLYELLGEEVNSIYDTKDEDEIFIDNTKQSEVKTEPFSKELYIKPAKINIKKLNKKNDNKFNELVNPFDINRGKVIKNKSNNKEEVQYDEDYQEEYNNGIVINVLSNKKVLYFLMILIFVFVCILSIKAFYFGKAMNNYNKYEKEYEVEETKVYADKRIDSDVIKKGTAMQLVDCLSNPIDTNKIPNNIKAIIKEINDYYRSSSNYFAFTYKDISTGFTVSYNENGNVWAASTIKAPVNIYLYELASQDKTNLDEELTYTSNYYIGGTGLLKNKEFNTKYTIRTLSEYAIVYSDNVAHNMLMDKYGKNNIRDFWKKKGTDVIFTGNDNWGMINAHDATIYMSELYRFYLENDKFGEELMNNFINAKTKFIYGKNDYIVANKSGWGGSSQHDASIIFADNPYIVVALSNLGMSNSYMNYFNKVNDLAYRLHTEYWKYKMEECNLN